MSLLSGNNTTLPTRDGQVSPKMLIIIIYIYHIDQAVVKKQLLRILPCKAKRQYLLTLQAHFTSKQILPFGFAEQYMRIRTRQRIIHVYAGRTPKHTILMRGLRTYSYYITLETISSIYIYIYIYIYICLYEYLEKIFNIHLF